jgi:hypothetical protein
MVLKALVVLVGCMGSLAFAAPEITPKVALTSEYSPMLVAGIFLSTIPNQTAPHLIADSLDFSDTTLLP